MKRVLTRLTLCMVLVASLVACNERGRKSVGGEDTKSEAVLPPPDEATTTAHAEGSRVAIDSLVARVQRGDNAGASQLIAYQGSDGTGRLQRSYNYNSEVERVEVDKTFFKLQVLVQNLQSISYNEFVQEHEQEADWYVWEVELNYEDATKEKVTFALVKVGEGYVLGDMD